MHALFLTAAVGILPRATVGPPKTLDRPVALGVPAQASASYAMQNAAQVSYDQRKASGFKPVATSDRETLAALQDKIDDKRRFRPDENDLGIIDTYTKKSAQERLEYDRAQEEEKSRKKNEYQSIPGVEL